jgi:hypothetical protein
LAAGTSPVCLIEGVKEEMGNEIVESFKSIGSEARMVKTGEVLK